MLVPVTDGESAAQIVFSQYFLTSFFFYFNSADHVKLVLYWGEWMELLSPEETVPMETGDGVFSGLSRVMWKDFAPSTENSPPLYWGGGRNCMNMSQYN